MKVNKLYLKNFRNISEIEILPQDEINVICGENAQGKTNIIEALWLFSGAKSFRGSKDFELIKKGEKSALISTDFTFLGVKNEAQIKISDKKTAFLNEKELSSASKLAGNFNAVIGLYMYFGGGLLLLLRLLYLMPTIRLHLIGSKP